jgi:hypothetical protein
MDTELWFYSSSLVNVITEFFVLLIICMDSSADVTET